MENNIKIVDAGLEDSKSIGYIQSQAWLCAYPNSSIGISKEDIQRKIDEWDKVGEGRIIDELKKENSKTWIARDGATAVGFIAVSKKNGEGIIEALHVLPEYQGKGIGTKLLEKALEWLGKIRVTTDVVTYNISAINFYKKFGFIKHDKISDDQIELPNGQRIQKIIMSKEAIKPL